MKLSNLVNVERIQYGNKLKLYFREGKTKRVTIVDSFYPYFYVDDDYLINHPKVRQVLKTLYNRHKIKEAKHTPLKSINDTSVSKIVYYDPYQTYELRELFYDDVEKYKCYEADIEYQRRWLIDEVDELEKANYRKLYIDIETTTTFGFPDWEHPEKEKVTCVSLADSYTKQVVTFILAPDSMKIDTAYKKVQITDEELGQGSLFIFKYEHQMINAILQAIEKVDPDLICGWNVYFDVIYLMERAKALQVDWFAKKYKYFAKRKEAKYAPKGKNIQQVDMKIERFIVFDLLGPYKQLEFRELPSYSLDWVVKEELNIEKGKLRITDFTRFWQEEFERFWKYNRLDAKYVMMVDDKAEIVDYFEDLRVSAKLPRIDMTNVWSKITDNVILNLYKGKRALPTKYYPDNFYENREKIKGGYVKDLANDLIGIIIDNVYVLDFKSMYPNLMIVFNLSKDTMNFEGIGYHSYIPEDNVDCYFDSNKEGILPTTVAYMLQLKEDYTKKRDAYPKYSPDWAFWEKRRFSVKTVINSVYGVSTYQGFRLFERAVGATITYLGRTLIQYIHKRLEADGIRVIYADTDSSFIQLPAGENIDEIAIRINDIYTADFMRENYPDFKKLTLTVDVEKYYSQAYFIAKKTYIGRKTDGKLQYVGGDLKKNVTPPIVRSALEYVVSAKFDYKDIDEAIIEGIEMILNETNIDNFKIPSKLERRVLWEPDELKTYREIRQIYKYFQLKTKAHKSNDEKKTFEKLKKTITPRQLTPEEKTLIEEKPYAVSTIAIKGVKRSRELWNIDFKTGQKFYVVELKDGVIAFDRINEQQEQYLYDNLDRANYLEIFAQKVFLMHLSDKESVLDKIKNLGMREAPAQSLN